MDFLQRNDKNGYYNDERYDLEELQKLSLEESIKYYETIKYSKDVSLYNKTYNNENLYRNFT
ncbi:hypothetical protein ACSXAF_15180 (plasmid) [Clostridium perfringens]